MSPIIIQMITYYYYDLCGGSNCIPNEVVFDNCNCFLHSYKYKGHDYEGDTFKYLKPFVEYVSTNHINTNVITLIQLKNYAKNFKHTNLSFVCANWN
jgi:hypothetical protein